MCLEKTFVYTYCGHSETTIYDCDEHLIKSPHNGIVGYSLCPEYKNDRKKRERMCCDCYVADQARKKIGKIGRVLETPP